MMRDVTDINTLRVFRFVRDFKAQHGISPSQREIAKGTFLSTTTMVQHLTRLEAKGWLIREYNIPRSISIGELAPGDTQFDQLWQEAIQRDESE